MQIKPKNSLEASEKTDFQQLWLRYIVYWPYFVLLFVVSFGTAWLYLQYTTPIYGATARILIKDETKGSEDSKAVEFLNNANSNKLIENEIEVISSKSLIDNVVKSLALYAPVSVDEEFKATAAYVTCPVRVEVKNPLFLTEIEKVYFTFNKDNQKILINRASYPLNTWIKVNTDSLRFVLNPRYDGTKVKRYYYSLIHPGSVSWPIKDNLEVTSTSKVSTILHLLLKDEVPERAEDILNGLMDAYNAATLNDKNTLVANTLSFVEDRLRHVEQELGSIEGEIQEYKSNTGSIDIGTQGGLFLKNVSDNDQKISEINMQLAVLNQVENYVHNKDNKAGIVPSTVGIDDPILSNLLNLLYTAELEYEKLKNTEGQNSPSLISISNQIKKIRPSIIENIQSHRKTLGATKSNVQSTNESYSSVIRTIPEKEKRLVDINRKRNIVSGIYTFLLQKREDLALSYAASIPNTTIVDKAEALRYPVSPRRKKVYLFAFAIPFIVGIGAITFKETFNSKILFRHEIETATDYPVLGEVTHNKSKAPIVIGKTERTFIAEQFRQLRVAISRNKSETNNKRILITSSIAGEGKSFIALNLGMAFALTDKKVVLLELDISNPSISNKINIAESPGIADYLQGNSDLGKIIKRYENSENLFVIPSGVLKENNFSESLENGKINDLLYYLNDIFDYIIIDTAPVNAKTDAYILSSPCDITLYVIRHNYTPKVFIQRLDQNDQLKNIAIVFNDIRPRGFGKHHFGYGYGYGYVYNERNRKKQTVKT